MLVPTDSARISRAAELTIAKPDAGHLTELCSELKARRFAFLFLFLEKKDTYLYKNTSDCKKT